MAETAQATVAPALQPAIAPMATTPMGPLRLDSMDGGGPPSSGKMVSLADLHANTNTPGTGPGQPQAHVSISPRFLLFSAEKSCCSLTLILFFYFFSGSRSIRPFTPTPS
jgi:hypothetical protein